MKEKMGREALSNGKVLLNLKNQLIKDTSEEKLISMLSCLRDSIVHAPFSPVEGGGASKGRGGSVRMRPEVLKHPNGTVYFPVFSQPIQIPDEYKIRFTILPVSALQCLEMAHAIKDVQGLVLDAFTEPFVIPFHVADIMTELPSLLETQDDK